MALPTALHSTAQVRALDAHASRDLGVPGYTLMKRAGEAALRFLRTCWPTCHRVAIVCGGGNNGGDGYVLARFAQAAGLTVTVLAAVAPERLAGDALQAYRDFVASGGHVSGFQADRLQGCEVVVDALLGTGLASRVRAEAAAVIAALNGASRPIFSLDVPSGLDSDTGEPLGAAVRAECTVTFVALKTGLYLGSGPEHAGAIYFDDLEVPVPATQEFAPRLERIVEAEISAALPRRAHAAHKGDFGRVLIVGGGAGMPGAVRLAGEAALRVGAGLVTVAVAPQNVVAIAAGRPELICLGLEQARELEPAIERADVIAVGPGLGKTPWSASVLDVVLQSDKPLVVDADALNILAERSGQRRRGGWILTPHPGEAARLLETTTGAIQRDRLAALGGLVERYGGVVVLKGAGTLVGAEGCIPGLCERGNPGMASAGMGDVLTGATAGVLAQCADPWRAARVAVLVHAMSGDSAARSGERGLLAGDVARELRSIVNL
ncbi:MAG: NAD(P)H-hydrate dehydratase [Steroidobacteraceae bacterium]